MWKGVGSMGGRMFTDKLVFRWLEGFGAWKRKMFEDWNSRWAEWIRQNPNATPQQIINFANKLAQEFGLPPISF
jgi:hypothetical protein